jgi:hypothetical protein
VFSADRDLGYRSTCGKALVVLGVLAMMVSTGCQSAGSGFSDTCHTQVQFYSPPGATVEVKMFGPNSGRQIMPEGPFGDRLERSPEESCVFNLAPGRYEFKYTAADGLPGANIYGELEVQYANTHEAQIFQRRSFVPIALPSEFYRRVEANGDEIFPYRGQGFRTAIDEDDLERLKAGDVVEKVFVVADLEKAEKLLKQTEVDLAAADREIEYTEARFREAYYSFRSDVTDPVANFFGTDRSFIRWEKKRQEVQQKHDKLVQLRQRTEALLKGARVQVGNQMLVLATQEVVRPHRDAVHAAEHIGEVVLVMRIGGRHMKWGDPRAELAANAP